MIEAIGTIASILAVAGVCCNNRRLRICFPIWLISNALTLAIHANAGIWSLALRDLIFFALAVEGWVLWRKKEKEG